MRYMILLLTFAALFFPNVLALAQRGDVPENNEARLNDLLEAVESGEVAYNLTDPNEIRAILGEPQSEVRRKDGEMTLLDLQFSNVEVNFTKFSKYKDSPFVLGGIRINGKEIELDEDGPLVLRTVEDLRKLNRFDGLQNVSLKNLDLTKHHDYLKNLTFDTLTQWPSPEKLPHGFEPHKLLDDGKNPGMGIRTLHKEGINGTGIGVAIIDQPLLLGHEEYTSRLVRYDATGSAWMEPQMHGPPIASILVGQTLGVAPRAELTYFAGSKWRDGTSAYIQVLDMIMELNRDLPKNEKIRVVNISDGLDGDAWRKARMKAQEAGILVVTCDREFLDYGKLALIEGKDPDRPESYRLDGYAVSNDMLLVPTGNKTTASHRGINVYTYYREGGMSWGAPYIAGLAALAFQVNADVQPQTIIKQLVKTATHTEVGPVVNPRGFIESIKRSDNLRPLEP